MVGRFAYSSANGRTATAAWNAAVAKTKAVCAWPSSNYWSVSEYNANNPWYVNFNNGNVNNNNRYNSYRCRPVVALTDEYRASWWEAYFECCRNKMCSRDCEEFRLTRLVDVEAVAEAVATYTYRPGTARVFAVTRPRLREIWAADFADRIVQTWICLRLVPLFEQLFERNGNVSFNCRKGYGTQAAQQALRRNMQLTAEREQVEAFMEKRRPRETWVGHFDMQSCFMSIDKQLLADMIERFIDENYRGADRALLKWVTRVMVMHCPPDKCEVIGDQKALARVPPHKSLRHVGRDKGLPIGNLTSQQLVNFYLSPFDEEMTLMASLLGCRYLRFVDDWVVTGTDSRKIRQLYDHGREWLMQHLHMRMHPDKIYIQPARHGCLFVGAVIRPDRTYLSNSTLGSMDNMMHDAAALCERVAARGATDGQLLELEHYETSINSYLGFCQHHSSYAIRRGMMKKHSCIFRCFYVAKNFTVVHMKRNKIKHISK